MAKNNRINTDSVFETLIGKNGAQQVTEGSEMISTQDKEVQLKQTKGGRKAKPDDEKTIQVSIYTTKGQAREWKMQAAEEEKEKDKSALARVGLDIVLSLSNEEYNDMKILAEERETTPGKIVKEALNLLFENVKIDMSF